jgi:tripartite-type tricarboxylate transporter receptor subunit TctC
LPIARRTFVGGALAASASLLPRGARADFPERPIRLIVPFAAGGAVDSVARVLGKALTDNLGQSIVIENRGGAGGVIGMEVAAHAAADGYTLLLSHSGLTAMPGLYAKLPFDPVRDLTGVITAASGAYVLAVNASQPFASVAELIAYAKANQGKLSFGSAGVGSIIHLAGELFRRVADIDIVHVSYKGAAPAISDVMGGQIQMMFAPAVNAIPLAAAGKLRALGVTSAKRSRLAPELPTIAESGLPGFEVTGWYGLAAPAATPPAAVAKINAQTNRALVADQVIAQLRLQGLEPVGDTAEEATDRIKSGVAQWTKVIRDAGIKPL